ncbi:Uncharacterised protein [Staphylococcus aureus]|nr:Uncharacterised protein [Staphylococcus aureus]
MPTPDAKPINALIIGNPAAMTEPNVINNTTNATMIPTSSELPPTSVDVIPVPVNSVCTL